MSIENFNFVKEIKKNYKNKEETNNENTNNNENEENTFIQSKDEEEVNFIFQNVEFSSYYLRNIIEIKDKNLILIAFSKSKNIRRSDVDFRLRKYIISIINTNTY